MRFVFISVLALAAFGADRWQPLFNGKDTTGWQMTGPGRFLVEDGLLVTEGGMGLLYYEREAFGNATLRVVFKTQAANDNSGVYIRLPEKPKDPWYGVHNGYEVQIAAGGDEWHRTGSIYSISKTTGEWQQNPAGEWNTMDIVLKGKETIVYLNGKKVNQYREGQPVPPRVKHYEPVRGPRPDVGYIGLQNHDAKSRVFFREISIKR